MSSSVSQLLRRLCLAALLVMLAGPFGTAGADILLRQGNSVPQLGNEMQVLLDDGRGLAGIVAAYEQGRFSDAFALIAKAGAPYQPIWAATRLTNGAPDDGRAHDSWILEFRTYGLVAVEAFLVRASGLTEGLLDHSIHRPFESRHYSGTQLHSSPLRLAPGESALLLTKQVFGPVAGLDLALMTGPDHAEHVFTRSLTIAAWYAFMIACLLFHFGFSLSMRSRVGVSYGAALSLGLLFVAYLDGFLFRFGYPQAPQWHLTIGIALLLATSAVGFASALISLRDLSENGSGGRLLRAGVAMSLLGAIATPFVAPEIMANIAYVAFVAMLVTQVFAAAQWRRVFGVPRVMLQVLMIMLALVVAVMLAAVLTGLFADALPVEWLIKAIYALAAVWTIASLSTGLVSMRRDHEASLRREFDAVSERERVARDLLDSERNYNKARALADQRRAQLASVSHDFRQPLTALRLAVAEFGHDLEPDQRSRLSDAFDYMEQLSSDLLDETRDEGDETAEIARAEAYPISLVLDAVAQMFSKEASAKGLDLRVRMSSRPVTTPPLILTRIIGNLVSNAVKYTVAGRVLVGVQSGPPGKMRVLVCDTGPGMSEAELARVSLPYQKGAASQGAGLGLAICFDLCSQHGLTLSAASIPEKGTRFELDIPPASPA